MKVGAAITAALVEARQRDLNRTFWRDCRYMWKHNINGLRKPWST